MNMEQGTDIGMEQGTDMDLQCKKSSGCRRGVVLSIEALLAALLLFTALLLASALAGMSGDIHLPLLRQYAQDIASVGLQNGQWIRAAAGANDSSARNLIESLPAGLCVQVEVYANTPAPASLAWSYTRSRCAASVDTVFAQAWVGDVYRQNHTDYSYYLVRVRTYARDG